MTHIEVTVQPGNKKELVPIAGMFVSQREVHCVYPHLLEVKAGKVVGLMLYTDTPGRGRESRSLTLDEHIELLQNHPVYSDWIKDQQLKPTTLDWPAGGVDPISISEPYSEIKALLTGAS